MTAGDDAREQQWQRIEALLQVVAPGFQLRPGPTPADELHRYVVALAERSGLRPRPPLTLIQGGRDAN